MCRMKQRGGLFLKCNMETQNKKPRDYQEAISTEAADIMAAHGAVYLAMQVRTGKTITALMAASKYGARRVLFVSKLKALDSIRFDYSDVLNGQAIEGYKLEVTNYESLHKLVPVDYDVLILDEAHGLGQYPKPSQRAERIREICTRQAKRPAVIYLSGTPTPESYAQMFHQFWASAGGPWGNYKTFYQWHKDYGKPAERWLGQRKVAVYDDVPAGPVMDAVKPYLITWTQEEAGFECVVREQVETVPMPAIIRRGIDLLRKDGVIIMKDGDTIEGSEAVKKLGKMHQLCGGTVITDGGRRLVLDTSKAQWIADNYGAARVAVFYKYQAEREAIEQVLGKGCDTAEQFNQSGGAARIFLQIISGREGVNLSSADVLIMYNVDFAAVSYWQARARMQSMNRSEPALVVWLQYSGGIEPRILEAVRAKQDYTVRYFERDLFGGKI